MIPKFVLIDSAAKMPSSVRSPYRRLAIIETDGERMPKRICATDRACVRIVRVWDRLSVGRTSRCAYRRALTEAQTELASLLSSPTTIPTAL